MKVSTKERIVNAAIDLFSQNGYAETSIRDIAKNVGVKTSSIYYYFESKEAILHYCLDMYMEVATHDKHYRKWSTEKDAVLSGKEELTIPKLLDYLFFHFDRQDYDRNCKLTKILCSEAVRYEPVRRHMEHLIKSGYLYIKDILDSLLAAKRIAQCDTAKLSMTLYAIAFAFMHLETVGMHTIGDEQKGADMFVPLEFVLRGALKA